MHALIRKKLYFLRELLFIHSRKRGYEIVRNKESKKMEIDNWLASEFILRKLVPITGIRPFPLDEQMLMVAAVCWIKPTHIFEWGTHVGKSARIFYEISSYFNINSEIHSIDLPDDKEHIEHPKNSRGIFVRNVSRVQLHQGDGLELSLSILKRAGPTAHPLFFVDGDHSYESVKRELEGIIREASRASILLHDTFYQHGNSKYNVGPYQAIKDILKSFPNTYSEIHTDTGIPGITFLYPKED